jgi:hypothetical protein
VTPTTAPSPSPSVLPSGIPVLAFTVNFPNLNPAHANATFQQRFRAAVARAAQVATDAVAITLASPGVVVSALTSPGVTLGTEVRFPESNTTNQADGFAETLASGGSSAIVEAGKKKIFLFSAFARQTALSFLRSRSFFLFQTNSLSKNKKRTAHEHTHNARPRDRLCLRPRRGNGSNTCRDRAFFLAGERRFF